MRLRIRVFGAALLTAASGALLLGAGTRAELKSVSTQVAVSQDTMPWYLDAQADSGEAVFVRTCKECHEKVDVNGPDFRAKWGGRPVYRLFERIRSSMPDSDPGSLPMEEYTYVVAYVLKLNGIPSTTMRLVPDSAALEGAKIILAPPAGF